MHYDRTCFTCFKYTSNIGNLCVSCARKTDDAFERRRLAARQVSLVRMHLGGVMHRIHAATGVCIPTNSSAHTAINYNLSPFWQTELREMIFTSRRSNRPALVFGSRLSAVPFGNGTHHGNLVFRLHAVRGEGAIVINAHGGIGKQEDKRFAAIWSNGFTEQHMQETR
jgi:hypothetical protein